MSDFQAELKAMAENYECNGFSMEELRAALDLHKECVRQLAEFTAAKKMEGKMETWLTVQMQDLDAKRLMQPDGYYYPKLELTDYADRATDPEKA